MRVTSKRAITMMKRLMVIVNTTHDEFDVSTKSIQIGEYIFKATDSGVSYQSRHNGFALNYVNDMESRGLVIALTTSKEVVQHYIIKLVQKMYQDSYGDALTFQDPLIDPVVGRLCIRSTGCPVVSVDLETGKFGVEGGSIIPSPKEPGIDSDDLSELRGLMYMGRFI